MSSCVNCKRVLTEVEELKNMVKSLESTVKNLSTSIKSLTNSNCDSDVINKRRRPSNIFDAQIGPVTRSNKNTSNIKSKKLARILSKYAVVDCSFELGNLTISIMCAIF